MKAFLFVSFFLSCFFFCHAQGTYLSAVQNDSVLFQLREENRENEYGSDMIMWVRGNEISFFGDSTGILPLRKGDVVDSTLNFISGDSLRVSFSFEMYGAEEFAGFLYQREGAVFYGWVALNVINPLYCEYQGEFGTCVHRPEFWIENYYLSSTKDSSVVVGEQEASEFIILSTISEKVEEGGVFPNPVNDQFELRAKEGQVFDLYSLEGRLIQNGLKANTLIQIENLNEGIYLLKEQGGAMVYRLLKK